MSAESLLFAMFASGFDAETLALFVTIPSVPDRSTARVMVAVPPLGIVPNEHVTVVVPLQVPWLGR